ncbi:hypothetical protein POVCU2_0046420 [Plasmodium ovale curtisi]|uniref:Uncharacterized protein n=1 Tax=Plasmodium ovale curtisi TaxID=864141 RepID=A0A1A8W8S9_PLAOA|nr:hypothetical protein POVCU2_0046420 [Plasmodium ovale curtisi]
MYGKRNAFVDLATPQMEKKAVTTLCTFECSHSPFPRTVYDKFFVFLEVLRFNHKFFQKERLNSCDTRCPLYRPKEEAPILNFICARQYSRRLIQKGNQSKAIEAQKRGKLEKKKKTSVSRRLSA